MSASQGEHSSDGQGFWLHGAGSMAMPTSMTTGHPAVEAEDQEITLASAKERLEELREIQRRVRKGDLNALIPFRDNTPLPGIDLKAPIRVFDANGHQKPVSVLRLEGKSPAFIAEQIAIVEKYFSGVEFQRTESLSGEPVLVAIGVEYRNANAAVRLEIESLEAQAAVTRLSQEASPAIDTPILPDHLRHAVGGALPGLAEVEPNRNPPTMPPQRPTARNGKESSGTISRR